MNGLRGSNKAANKSETTIVLDDSFDHELFPKGKIISRSLEGLREYGWMSVVLRTRLIFLIPKVKLKELKI